MNLDTILSERLAILGGTGSGKSYTARGLAERVIGAGNRLGVIDPTGVWWGLRSGFPVVLFGGDHADLPINEHAGRLVAQAVATSQQSWILDTSALKTKAAERRFMLDFLDALYETNRNRITLIVDEADRFSPQRMTPETARLHERMEEIVRRGRVRGFTPWLITQRPASLNKDVLSQATAYICMKMTGAHDRGAIADVIEGQADRATAKAIVDAMPKHKTGSGLVWSPMQDILLPVHFPKIRTFDSMRPEAVLERGDKPLPSIDLGALKERLATVEEQAKANDPKALKAEITRLKAELAKRPTACVHTDQWLSNLVANSAREGRETGSREMSKQWSDRVDAFRSANVAAMSELVKPMPHLPPLAAPSTKAASAPALPQGSRPAAVSKAAPVGGQSVDGALPSALQRVVNAIGWWRKIGFDPVERNRACVVAGYSPNASTFGVYVGQLVARGLVVVSPGKIGLTDAGIAAAVVPDGNTQEDLRAAARGLLKPQEQRVFDVVYAAHPNEIARDDVADAVGLSKTASTLGVYLGAVAAYGIIEKGSPGHVKAADWLFP